jgi:Flp pilus assembly protein CpaB
MDVLERARTLVHSPTALPTRRRLVAAALAAAAVVCALNALRPPPIPTRQIWVAAHDLAGGAPLTTSDIRAAPLPLTALPHDALRATQRIVGRVLAAPMRTGEPLTDVRLLSPALLTAMGTPTAVAVPVRVADGPAALALVHAGDRIDVLAVADADAAATSSGSVVVHDVQVLATPANDPGNGTDSMAGLLIVAASSRQAAALAQVAATSRLSVSLRRPA